MTNEILNELGSFFINEERNNRFQGLIEKIDNHYEFKILNHDFDSYDKYILINGKVKNYKVSFILFNEPMEIVKSLDNEYLIENRTYRIQHLFIGSFFKNINSITFKNISIRLNTLNSVINISSFYKQHNIYELHDLSDNELCYQLENFKLKIRLNNETSHKITGTEKLFQNYQYYSINLLYEEEQDLYSVIDDAKIIENLFTLIIGKTKIIEMKENKDNIIINLKLDIISNEKNEDIRYTKLKLNEDNIEKIFKTWFENFNEFDGVYDLYFSFESYTLNAETLLITYTRVLESYHRHKFGKKYSFKHRIESICNQLKKYTIFDRYISIYSKDDESIENIIKDFIKIVDDNRNYYTHYNKENKRYIYEGLNLIKLNDSLKLIIELLFLTELPFSKEEIDKITLYEKKYQPSTFFEVDY